MLESLKVLFDKENGAVSLVKQSKEGRMNPYGRERLSAKLYVYEAFKPIIEANGISKKEYLSSGKTEQKYRKIYLSVMSTYLKERKIYETLLPELYASGHGIDVQAFTTLLQQSNSQWLEMQKNMEENKQEAEVMQELKEKVSYLSFLTASPEQRKKLLAISHDHNRTQDKQVFQQLQEYIEEKEDVDKSEYLDSPELREKYRKEYKQVAEFLEQNPRLVGGTVEENINYVVDRWHLIAMNKNLVSRDCKREFMDKYSIVDFAHLSKQEVDDLYQQTNEEFDRMIQGEQQRINNFYRNLNDERAETEEYLNAFFARQIAQTDIEFEKMMSELHQNATGEEQKDSAGFSRK